VKGTVLHGGTVVTPMGEMPADIVIRDGLIAAIKDRDTGFTADKVIDVSGKIILAGAIDGHTHFMQNDPELSRPHPEEFEGFTTGGSAAAAGGITTTIEMPQSDPPAVTRARVTRKRELAAQDAIVDFALWGGIIPGTSDADITGMLEAGVVGFKAYMCDSDEEFPGIDDAQLLAAFRLLADSGVVIGLHAENHSLLRAGLAAMRDAGRSDPLAHAESRPSIVETEAVHRAIFFSRQTGMPIHIVHLSAPGSAALIKQAKNEGLPVTCETSAHYLTLDLDDLKRLGPFAKCAPALRSRNEVEELWDYVADRTIDCLATDHCAYTAESKRPGQNDIFQAPNGLPEIQTCLPVFVDEARRRGISWEVISQMTSLNPARIWGIDDRKGAIRVGADADLTVIDPSAEWTVHGEDLLQAQHWTQYENRIVRGRVILTLVRGTTVFDSASASPIRVQPGFGRFVSHKGASHVAVIPAGLRANSHDLFT
jgi:allantoinase